MHRQSIRLISYADGQLPSSIAFPQPCTEAYQTRIWEVRGIAGQPTGTLQESQNSEERSGSRYLPKGKAPLPA